MVPDSELLLESAIESGVYFQLLHPLERIVYNVNTLCNQMAEKRLWEKLGAVIKEEMKRGMKRNYGINCLSLREMKAITIEVLNRKEIRRELETAAVLRCLICGKKLGKWYVTINDRRVESTKRDKRVSEDEAVFYGVIPSRAEDNEEYCYVLRGAMDYWEAVMELIHHLIKDHGEELGKRLLPKEQCTEADLFKLVFDLVVQSIEKVLKQEVLFYERAMRVKGFPFRSLALERRMVRRKKKMTFERIRMAYTEAKSHAEVLQSLELFEDGYYDIEVIYKDAPSAEEMALYRESGVKSSGKERSSQMKVWRRPYLQSKLWEDLERMVGSIEKGIPVKIFCEQRGKDAGIFCSSVEELVAHLVRHHPDVSLGKRFLRKIVKECTSIGWLYHAREKMRQDVFAYLGPHYVDMLPPVGRRSCVQYGMLRQDQNRVYELYTRSFEPYRKYLLGRKRKD
ncbi:MAG: hypothetical protein ABDK94_10445 [Atribacterota bacterium]